MPLTPEQLAAHNLGIGGSDISAVLGLHPYKTPLQLYQEKLGLIPPAAPSDDAVLGSLLEDGIGQFYAQKHAVTVVTSPLTLRHPRYAYLVGHPDRLVPSPEAPGLLEVKLVGVDALRHWHPAFIPGHALDEDDLAVPDFVALQGLWYLGLMPSARWLDIAVLLFSRRKYGEWRLEPDPELFAQLVDAAVSFHDHHLVPQIPPPPASPRDLDAYLRRRFPTHDEDWVEGGPEADALAKALEEAMAMEKQWTARKEDLQTQFKARIGEHLGIRGVDPENPWFFTWKKTRSNGTDWEGLARALGATPAQIKAHQRPGYRRVRFVSARTATHVKEDDVQ